jgi:hypothetical protein
VLEGDTAPALKMSGDALRPLPVSSQRGAIADPVMHMKTAGEVRGFLSRKTKQIWPNVSILDMRI